MKVKPTDGVIMASEKPTQAIADFFSETVAEFDGEVEGQGDFTIERAAQVVRVERTPAPEKP